MILSRKLTVIILLFASAVTAFATLGDGRTRTGTTKRSLLTNKSAVQGTFSLRSGYSFRGNQVINAGSERYLNLNTVVSYQRGHTTYVMPMKKKVLLENVKIDISNRQLRRN